MGDSMEKVGHAIAISRIEMPIEGLFGHQRSWLCFNQLGMKSLLSGNLVKSREKHWGRDNVAIHTDSTR